MRPENVAARQPSQRTREEEVASTIEDLFRSWGVGRGGSRSRTATEQQRYEEQVRRSAEELKETLRRETEARRAEDERRGWDSVTPEADESGVDIINRLERLRRERVARAQEAARNAPPGPTQADKDEAAAKIRETLAAAKYKAEALKAAKRREEQAKRDAEQRRRLEIETFGFELPDKWRQAIDRDAALEGQQHLEVE